jgi:hypothetical protein
MSTRTLDTDAGHIEYSLERSSRRTLVILIGPEAAVRVRAPRRLAEAEIERFVRERASWIVRKRGEVAERAARRLPAPGAAELAEAHRVLDGRFAVCWERFRRPGEVRPELRVRVMRTRWGSLTGSGRVSLNAYLVRAPIACIDAVIYHELSHLRFRGHGPDFYRELARYVPDWKARRRELRELL